MLFSHRLVVVTFLANAWLSAPVAAIFGFDRCDALRADILEVKNLVQEVKGLVLSNGARLDGITSDIANVTAKVVQVDEKVDIIDENVDELLEDVDDLEEDIRRLGFRIKAAEREIEDSISYHDEFVRDVISGRERFVENSRAVEILQNFDLAAGSNVVVTDFGRRRFRRPRGSGGGRRDPPTYLIFAGTYRPYGSYFGPLDEALDNEDAEIYYEPAIYVFEIHDDGPFILKHFIELYGFPGERETEAEGDSDVDDGDVPVFIVALSRTYSEMLDADTELGIAELNITEPDTEDTELINVFEPNQFVYITPFGAWVITLYDDEFFNGGCVNCDIGLGDYYRFELELVSGYPLYPCAVDVGDFNGDGEIDIVITNAKNGKVHFFEGNDGTILPKAPIDTEIGQPFLDGIVVFDPMIQDPPISEPVCSLVATDIDGDGDLDLLYSFNTFFDSVVIVTSQTSEATTGYEYEFILLNDGDANFAVTSFPSPGGGASSFAGPPIGTLALAADDLNGDGVDDIIKCGGYGVEVIINNGMATDWYFYYPGWGLDGGPAFDDSEGFDFYFLLGLCNSISTGDVDNDGDTDILVVTPGSVALLVNGGDGIHFGHYLVSEVDLRFFNGPRFEPGRGGPGNFPINFGGVLGDVNGDRLMDIVVVSGNDYDDGPLMSMMEMMPTPEVEADDLDSTPKGWGGRERPSNNIVIFDNIGEPNEGGRRGGGRGGRGDDGDEDGDGGDADTTDP